VGAAVLRRNEIAMPVDGVGESPDELGRPA